MRRSAIVFVLLLTLRSQAKHGGPDSDTPSPTVSDVGASSSSISASLSPTSLRSTSLTLPPQSSSQTVSLPPSAPSPPPSPFQFAAPRNATTCQDMTFFWHFTGTSALPMTMVVTNERVAQQSSINSTGVALVTRTLSTNISAIAGNFTWHSVNVPSGWYNTLAFDTASDSIQANTDPFFVRNGTNVSCVTAASSTSASTPVTTSPPIPTTTTGLSSKHLSTGALVGTVVGVLVGVVIVVAAFSVPRLWRRALPPRPQNRNPGGPYYLF